MSFWKNKHLLIAALMAPILGILTYLAIDMLVSEKPKPAQVGQSYILAELPNCRYSSGKCDLKNADFKLVLTTDQLGGDQVLLKLKSEFPLDGVMLAQQVNEDQESQPKPMRAVGTDGLNWSQEIWNPDPENQRLHLVASSGGSLYVGDAALKFTIKKTTFK